MTAEERRSPASDPQSLDRWFDERFAHAIQEWQAAQDPSLTLMVTKDSLDWAYPPFIIAATAAAMGWPVTIVLHLLWSDPVEETSGPQAERAG